MIYFDSVFVKSQVVDVVCFTRLNPKCSTGFKFSGMVKFEHSGVAQW